MEVQAEVALAPEVTVKEVEPPLPPVEDVRSLLITFVPSNLLRCCGFVPD